MPRCWQRQSWRASTRLSAPHFWSIAASSRRQSSIIPTRARGQRRRHPKGERAMLRSRSSLWITVVALSAFGCGEPDAKKASELRLKAIEVSKKNDWDGAIKYLDEAI